MQPAPTESRVPRRPLRFFAALLLVGGPGLWSCQFESEPAGKGAKVTIAPYAAAQGTTSGTGVLTEADGKVTLKLEVKNAKEGSRGVHVHVGSSCESPPGGHHNPDPGTRNGEFDNLQVDATGSGTVTSTRAGLNLTSGDGGILGRALVVHGKPLLEPDGGPKLSDAGTALPPPVDGCGVIEPG